ncbi:MAG: chromate transporter [Spirochaetales bacterium]|nr:chromate transporter [Spirochaetales bacterium]
MQEKCKRESLWTLFITFMKIGAMTFGGGYAMLPLLQKEVVNNHKWCSEADILDYFAVGQCTPGIIAVNTSTFIGYKTRGNLGGIVATLGFIFPSFLIISLLVPILEAFETNRYVAMALAGIRVCVCALITVSVLTMSKKSIIDVPTFILMALVLLVMIFFSPSPIILVIVSTIYGIVVSMLKVKKEVKK